MIKIMTHHSSSIISLILHTNSSRVKTQETRDERVKIKENKESYLKLKLEHHKY